MTRNLESYFIRLFLVAFVGFLGVMAWSAIDAGNRHRAHRQAVLDSCLATGRALFQCEQEISTKACRTFDVNLGFGRKD